MSLTVVSCNVNGLRAAQKKGFLEWVRKEGPHIIGMQEVRATAAQLGPFVCTPGDFHAHFSEARRAGYSGVGLYVSRNFETFAFETPSLDHESFGPPPKAPGESFDAEGRIVSVLLGNLMVVCAYFPNGNGKERDNSRVPYKLEFYRRVRAYLEPHLEAGRKILVMGDWNTAHQAVDLARPKQNIKTSGFLPEEREAMDLWMKDGWVDTFRHFYPAPTEAEIAELVALAKKQGKKKAERDSHPGEGHYSWWSQRGQSRANNVGWRIDYIIASPNVIPYLKSARIHKEVMVSDHCPISVELDEAILID